MSTSNPSTTKLPSSQQQHPSNQKFTLLLFASAQTYTTTSTLTLSAPTTLFQLFTHLEKTYPGINAKILRSSQIVINLEYVDCDIGDVVDRVLEGVMGNNEDGEGNERIKKREGDDILIKVGDEVAVVPPVSSG